VVVEVDAVTVVVVDAWVVLVVVVVGA